MNREKYIKDISYREGINTVISIFENDIRKFVDNFTELNNKLSKIKKENEV